MAKRKRSETLDDVSVLHLSISIVHSKSGGDKADAYSRADTIARVQHLVETMIEGHVPRDYLCSLVFAVRKENE